MNSDKKLLKTSVAAEFLCVPHRTFQRWVKEGKLIPEFVSDGGHNFFSEETLSRFKIDVQNQNAPLGSQNAQPAQTAAKAGNRLPVPQSLVTRLLKGGTTAEVGTADEENFSSVEVELEDIEEYYFDDNNDITIINDSFKATLPEEYRQNLTNLFGKLTVAPMNEIFSTPFNNAQTLITYAKIDFLNSGVTFNGKFDETHEIILNSLYSFYRAENILFTSRNILQHIFGNVPDHFQSGLVKIIDQHLDLHPLKPL